jgi:hypothetical protein
MSIETVVSCLVAMSASISKSAERAFCRISESRKLFERGDLQIPCVAKMTQYLSKVSTESHASRVDVHDS